MNQAETAFVHKGADGSWNLRWFTPQVEVSLCGHATLAAAHVLWQHAGETAAILEFHTLSGLLSAKRIGDEIQLDFPADFPQSVATVPPALLQLLGGQPHWFGQGRDDLIAVLDSADAVRNFVLGGAELQGEARERFAAIQERQAEIIAINGGRAAIVERGDFGNTPAPGETTRFY